MLVVHQGVSAEQVVIQVDALEALDITGQVIEPILFQLVVNQSLFKLACPIVCKPTSSEPLMQTMKVT